MQDLGYESHNSIQLLGSLWVFTVIFYIRLFVLLPILKIISLKFQKCKPCAKKLYKTLIFGEIILISLEAYIEFLIAGYMNYLF